MSNKDERDELGEEMSGGARVWREYSREAEEYDRALVDGWNRTTDVMLVFTALFSAIVTAFVVQTYSMLSPDPQSTSNAYLFEIASTVRAISIGNNSAVPAALFAPSGTTFTPSRSSIWINGLWFTSLTLSLSVGSLAMLIKQWLNAYVSVSNTTPLAQTRLRQYRYETMINWQIPAIIAALPLVMSFSLILFFAGVSILLLTLNKSIAISSLVIIGVTLAIHFASLILPAVSSCPWKLAVSPAIYRSVMVLYSFLRWQSQILRSCLCAMFDATIQLRIVIIGSLWWLLRPIYACLSCFSCCLRLDWVLRSPAYKTLKYNSVRLAEQGLSWIIRVAEQGLFWIDPPTYPSESQKEHSNIDANASVLDVRAILWLSHVSKRPDVVSCALQALSGFAGDLSSADELIRGNALDLIRHSLISCFHGEELRAHTEAELYVRGMVRIHAAIRTAQNGRDISSRIDDIAIFRRLRSSPVETTSLVGICASVMLHEMVEALEKHDERIKPLSPFSLRLLVNALGTELMWRKRWDNDDWTPFPITGWAGMAQRIITRLVRILNIDRSSLSLGDPDPSDTAIAVTLSIIVLGPSEIDAKESMKESYRKKHFYRLVLASLAQLLRRPDKFQCDNNIVLEKLAMVSRNAVKTDQTGEALQQLLKFVGFTNAATLDDVLLTLSRTPDNRLASFECSSLLTVLSQPESLSGASRFNLLICIDRLHATNSRMPETFRLKAVEQLIQWTRNTLPHPSIRSYTFRILGKLVHAGVSYNYRSESSCVRDLKIMVGADLLGAVSDFFKEPNHLQQEDVDRWIVVVATLCHYHGSAVRQQGLLQTLADWYLTAWRGHQLLRRHLRTLQELASTIHVTIDIKEDVSWFKPLEAKVHLRYPEYQRRRN